MPVPWLTVLQTVPWTDVIKNAPKVADGARKLWGAVSGKPAALPDTIDAVPARPVDVPALQSRVAALESGIAELHAQMLASSELIKALADQNAQLVRGLEAHRARWLGLVAALAVVGVAAVAALVWVFVWR